MRTLHFTKRDFSIEWFSGTGGGGQHRNKHQNCCRITHLATGLRATGQTARDRPTNQRTAFRNLAERLLAHYCALEEAPAERSTEVIRTYHAARNEVIDKASGLRLPYTEVVVRGDLAAMIEARKSAKEHELAAAEGSK